MSDIVAVVGAGAMGAAVAGCIAAGGARVLTVLEGRGPATLARAAAAGMQATGLAELSQAKIILSILPPASAEGFAQSLVPHLQASRHKPLFVDCNALSPPSVEKIGAIIAATGTDFVDVGIIGQPPVPGGYSPVFYASGDAASRLLVLREYGLDLRDMAGPIGAASALKMCYGGITKGITALASAIFLAAGRSGAGATLHAELAASQPALLAWFSRQIPGMYGKSYRWVAEMQEVSAFIGEDAEGSAMFAAIAAFYQRLAADQAGERTEVARLEDFLKGH